MLAFKSISVIISHTLNKGTTFNWEDDMKVYKAEKRISKKVRDIIENLVEYNDKYHGCYFWNKTGCASNRRSQEKQFAANNPAFSIISKKGLIKVEPYLSISCKNFYYSLSVEVNGKKSNISILKNMVR